MYSGILEQKTVIENMMTIPVKELMPSSNMRKGLTSLNFSIEDKQVYKLQKHDAKRINKGAEKVSFKR
ncbi:hypothetical protein TNCT_193701 [Trichonephila clavata]|uniref:Uncharacterized protein n=1 Tax=Trichonephila clavata TaxID=2740835 RepID=A0A8X6KSW1_TRICU|nr:hypothetical protein TNCT_193701 [Trichonephila clavata]